MPITCPTCGAAPPGVDVDLERGIGKCRYCSALFDISDQLAAVSGAAIQRRRAPVPMPAAVRVIASPAIEIEPGYRDAPARRPPVTIVRRWRESSAYVIALFCVFWNAFLVFWYRITVDAPIIFKLFPLIHVGAGLYMTYRTLATLLNTTTITVGDDELSVRHHPLPWPGGLRVPAAELAQLFTEEQITETKNGVSRSYHLGAVLKDGTKQRILANLPEPDQALFLEQQIEERLGIVDVEVGGEWQGPTLAGRAGP